LGAKKGAGVATAIPGWLIGTAGQGRGRFVAVFSHGFVGDFQILPQLRPVTSIGRVTKAWMMHR